MKNHVYADHAATTPLLPEALEAMLPWLKGGFGNPSSLHSFGREARKAVEEARVTIAECIHAKPEEIFFTSGGTEANNWVIKGTTGGLLVSAYEHHSILNAAKAEESRGREVGYVPPQCLGVVMADDLRFNWPRKYEWDNPVSLVSIMAVNNELGTVNNITELVKTAHKRGALFHTDAVQALGKTGIDVRESDVDFLSASAHKFGGPKGVGLLYAKDGKAPARLFDGGAQERGLRAGTENVAAIVGMAAALKASCTHLDDMEAHKRLTMLTSMLCAGIGKTFRDAFYITDVNQRMPMMTLPGFVSVTIPGHPAEGMLHIFDMKGIAVSAGAACNSRDTQVSHVLKAIGLSDDEAACTLRISLGPNNTEEDVNLIHSIFRLIAKSQPSMNPRITAESKISGENSRKYAVRPPRTPSSTTNGAC